MKRFSMGFLVIVIIAMSFGCSRKVNSKKENQTTTSSEVGRKNKIHKVIIKNNAANSAKTDGYIYKDKSDYIIINSDKNRFKTAKEVQSFIRLNNEQNISQLFTEKNSMAVAQDQVKEVHDHFKLAYGTIYYTDLTDKSSLALVSGNINERNISRLPKLLINKLEYKILN